MLQLPTASPTTATSVLYIGLILTLLNIIDKIVIWWRGGQAPTIAKIAETEVRMIAQVDRIERDMTKQVGDMRAHIDQSIEDVHTAITRELNGWSSRINDNREEIERNARAIEETARHHIEFKSESKMDRGHLGTRLVSVEAKVDAAIAGATQMELRLVNALGDSERRLMSAIRSLPLNGQRNAP